jgi:DNA-binding NarL/FixJ family response regulator
MNATATRPSVDPDVALRRRRVDELVAEGLTEREIARELGVSRTTVWTDKQVNKAAAR